MKKTFLLIPIILALTACSNVKYKQDFSIESPKFGNPSAGDEFSYPDWYTSVPDQTALYAVASERSTDLQFAVDKSMLAAKRELASNFSSHVNAMMKDFASEIGDVDDTVMRDINRTTKLVISKVNLIGVQRTNLKIVHESKGYRAFVKLRYAVDDSNRLLMEEIKRDRKLKHKLESSKSFKELEKSVKVEDTLDSGEVILLDVDNEDYKRRRDETLQKPNSVIGRVIVQ